MFRKMRIKAFTLIELLVVISIIALLLSILMPSLSRVKEAGKRTVCLNNVKSLALGIIMYTDSNDNCFPHAGTSTISKDGWLLPVEGYPFDPWNADKELQLDAIKGGLLYPYMERTDVYRCPIGLKNEFRTYSMTHALNGWDGVGPAYGGQVLTKISQVNRPVSRIMFLDDYIYDWDACWMIFNDRHEWWNPLPVRHGSGGNVFSFVDGHSGFQRWTDSRTVELGEKCAADSSPETSRFPELQRPIPNNEDLIWAQKAVWGNLGYTP